MGKSGALGLIIAMDGWLATVSLSVDEEMGSSYYYRFDDFTDEERIRCFLETIL